MTLAAPTQSAPSGTGDQPLDGFSHCHRGIAAQLHAFAELPALHAAAQRSREVAAATLALFQGAVIEHHADEERELFPAVQRSAIAGDEADSVRLMVDRLCAEHRRIEALWKRLEPAVKAVEKARPADLDAAAVQTLVQQYLAHAAYEEQRFLPLAERILGRNGNHMAALGLSLHMRHLPTVVGYI